MKVRLDFVSNSSSASFLLYIESTADTEDQFRKDMKFLLKDYFAAFLGLIIIIILLPSNLGIWSTFPTCSSS